MYKKVLFLPKLQSHFAKFFQYTSFSKFSILYLGICVGLQYG